MYLILLAKDSIINFAFLTSDKTTNARDIFQVHLVPSKFLKKFALATCEFIPTKVALEIEFILTSYLNCMCAKIQLVSIWLCFPKINKAKIEKNYSI